MVASQGQLQTTRVASDYKSKAQSVSPRANLRDLQQSDLDHGENKKPLGPRLSILQFPLEIWDAGPKYGTSYHSPGMYSWGTTSKIDM